MSFVLQNILFFPVCSIIYIGKEESKKTYERIRN